MILPDSAKEALVTKGIPSYMHGAIIRYYENRISPGDFLSAVINNDLKEACGRADDTNKHCLFDYILWFYNHAPSGSWGYQGAVSDWINGESDD